MKVIIPNRLELLSCSVSEGDEVDGVLWEASVTYARGIRVRHEHVRYESLADANRGNNPAETWSGISARWKRLGATAPYRMLDDLVETQTVSPESGPLTFGVPFNRATALALLNVEGGTAGVTVTDDEDGEELFADDISLTRDIGSLSLHAYNHELIDSRINVAVTDIPMPIAGTLSVSIDPGQGSTARLGHVVVGARMLTISAWPLWCGAPLPALPVCPCICTRTAWTLWRACSSPSGPRPASSSATTGTTVTSR